MHMEWYFKHFVILYVTYAMFRFELEEPNAWKIHGFPSSYNFGLCKLLHRFPRRSLIKNGKRHFRFCFSLLYYNYNETGLDKSMACWMDLIRICNESQCSTVWMNRTLLVVVRLSWATVSDIKTMRHVMKEGQRRIELLLSFSTWHLFSFLNKNHFEWVIVQIFLFIESTDNVSSFLSSFSHSHSKLEGFPFQNKLDCTIKISLKSFFISF